MRTIWFVRHGQSVANARQVFAGHLDSELTPLGEQQARDLRPAMDAIEPARRFSSDLIRAARTAEIAWPRATPVLEQAPALRERRMGAWEGRSYHDLAPDERALLVSWDQGPPGGESQAMLATRAVDWLAAEDDGAPWIVFAHGGLIRCLVGLLDGLPRDQIGVRRVGNAELVARPVPAGRWAELAVTL